jgi:hypothetical protein
MIGMADPLPLHPELVRLLEQFHAADASMTEAISDDALATLVVGALLIEAVRDLRAAVDALRVE